MDERLFTQQELDKLTKPTLDRALRAIREGKKQFGEELCKEMWEDFFIWHTGSINWIPLLLTHIGENYGEEAILDALMSTGEVIMKPWADRTTEMWKMGTRQKIEYWAKIWKCHLPGAERGRFTIQEDNEKFIFRHDPCGGGHVLIRQGAYDPPEVFKPLLPAVYPQARFLRVKNSYPWTFERKDFPVYCCHCAVFHEILPIKWTGYPLFVQSPPEKPEDPCIHYHYKNPQAVPGEYYERLGFKKQNLDDMADTS